MGIAKNLAEEENSNLTIFLNDETPCVFISYKSEDIEAAKTINSFLNNVVHIYTYFDINDATLRKSTCLSDDKGIVDSIKNGLSHCSHLLCLISDKTRVSWWVPYEIGFADSQEKQVALLKLKDVDEIPSFLKIKETLYNIEDFKKFLSRIGRYGTLFESNSMETLNNQSMEALEKFIDKGEQ